MTARVTEEGPRLGKIIRQKTEQGTKSQKSDESNKVLPTRCSHCGETPRSDSAEAGTQPIHIIHEVERVDHREYPEHGDCVVENLAVNEQRDPRTTYGHQR